MRALGVGLALAAFAPLPAAAQQTGAQGESETTATPITEADRLLAMGLFFDQSEPPSQDLAKARDLYCRAAALGQPEAVRRLGWLYFKGRGVPASEQVAGTMFRWALELGDGGAAGLSAALPVVAEVPPPCLAQAQIRTVDTLRARRAKAAGPPPASAVVDNPLQFRQGAPSLDQRKLVASVIQEARTYRLDPRLVLAVMRAESGFDPLARSPKNAQGLMQLIPETAQRFNVANPFDPVENMRGGMAYLRWLLAYYRGDVPLVLAAYNAGEGAVDRFRGVPPYAETLGYVQRIRALYPFDRHPFDTRALAAGERSWLERELAAAR